MFEDFAYITDEKFLSTYWLEEKVTCQKCRGKGKLIVDRENDRSITCEVCQGTGMVQRKHLNPSTL